MRGRQLGYVDYEQVTVKKRINREKFRAEMDEVVQWKVLIVLIEPHYPKSDCKGGCPSYPLATILRIHLS